MVVKLNKETTVNVKAIAFNCPKVSALLVWWALGTQ